MIVFYQIRRKNKKLGSLGVRTCQNCGYTGELYLSKDKLSVWLMFILPLFGCTTKKAIFCPRCGTPNRLSSGEFKDLRACIKKASDK